MKTTNIFNKLLCLVLMALCSMSVSGQKDFGKVSPQTADFIRYGNIPVSLYTGQVNVSIPLYHIQDKDFDIPVSLNYSGDGLKPNRRHGWSGLNWSVSGAGAVSREIYGAPDDHGEWYHTCPDEQGTSAGLMATKGYYRCLNYKTYNADSLYGFNFDMECDAYECHLPYVGNCFYDCEPDLFLFSMPGHSGRFLPCSNRQLEQPVYPNSYKYNLFGMVEQQHSLELKPSYITVTSSDGYVYTFGSPEDTHALEYSFSFHPTHNYDGNEGYGRPRINAWHLTKITAPNGRTVKFNYMDTTESTSSPFVKSDCVRNPEGANTPDLIDDFSYCALKGVVLESIEIEDTGLKVEFVSAPENCDAFYSYGVTANKYNAVGYQLDGIRVKQAGTTVYSCSLEYENRGHLRFLKKVTATDGGMYCMEYTHPDAYPVPTTEDVDTYGYWKDTGITPYSLLSQMTYPTGGKTVFGYERHTYNRAVRRTATNAEYGVNLVDSIGTLNAFRLNRLTSTSSEGDTPQTRTYTYTLWSNGNRDSGTLLRSRTFVHLDSYQVFQTTDRNDDYNVEEPVIGYTSVQERNADGSYTEYIYSDFQTCPDTRDTNFHWTNGTQSSGVLQAFSTASLLTSRWDQRGKLTSREVIDSEGNRKHYVRYCYRLLGNTIQPFYTELLEHDSPYTTSVCNVSGGLAANRIVMQEYPLIMEETVDCRDNTNVTATRLYYRNKDNFLSRLVETNSARDTIKTCYTYPDNTLGSNGSSLHLKNMIDKPVSEMQYLNSSALSTRRTVYKALANGDVVPDTVYVRKGTESEYMEACFPVYDAWSNPVHIVYGNGVSEVLVWGYGGRYLVARIVGKDYNTVKSALGKEPKLADEDDMSALEALRTSLSDVLVTTCTYIPSVGMTSMTAPSGEKTTYTYDGLNRLSQVKDSNGNTMEQYTYNYQQ